MLAIFCLCIAIQCGYLLYFFLRAMLHNFSTEAVITATDKVSVTVVICAKNEAENLRNHLPLVLSQQYRDHLGSPLFEVLVVNDGSADHTEEVLHTLEKTHTNLRHITIATEEKRHFKGKKFALSLAIEQVTTDWVVLTDADCRPGSNLWLQHMISPLSKGKEIVCGYGAYDVARGFLNAFVRWETMHTFLQYSSYAIAELPYMGVGRNLACTRLAFLKAQQSQWWNALPSGDDDLLIRAAGTPTNTAIVAHPDSFTYSPAKETWSEWLHQKQRHLSTGKYYHPNIKMLLGLYGLSHALMWVLFFILLWYPSPLLVCALLFIRCIPYWMIWQKTATALGDKKLGIWLPLCDISWSIYNFVLSPFIFFKNQKQWK